MAGPLGSRLTLARWLSPVAPPGAPEGVTRTALPVEPQAAGDRPFEAWLYRAPGRPRGSWLITPGLHFKGPADPRLDRFCRILAKAGFVVLAPFLPDHLQLRLERGAIGDLDRAFGMLAAQPDCGPDPRPGIFSVSFGSFPAICVAGRRGASVRRLLVFGGFARFREVCRFACREEAEDPFCQAVVFLNLVDRITGAPADTATLFSAWRRLAEETWNRPEMVRREAWAPVAERIASSLREGELRRLFRMGARLDGGGAAWVEAALAQDLPALDPEPAGVSCPVRIFHGADDPVIPTGQAALLAAMMPGSQMRITGLYGHADRARTSSPVALLKDGATLLAMLQALAG